MLTHGPTKVDIRSEHPWEWASGRQTATSKIANILLAVISWSGEQPVNFPAPRSCGNLIGGKILLRLPIKGTPHPAGHDTFFSPRKLAVLGRELP